MPLFRRVPILAVVIHLPYIVAQRAVSSQAWPQQFSI